MKAYDQSDIRRAAQSMIANHGGCAVHVAVKRARNLLGDDAKEARQTWERILKAIREIQGQTLH